MSKHDILEYFKDINFAYNSPVMFDILKDMLDELESENQAHGWISVKDRLPEEPPWLAKWVLVWFGETSIIHIEAPVVGKYNTINHTWLVLGKNLGKPDDIMEVTHWMPLPEPPKEET